MKFKGLEFGIPCSKIECRSIELTDIPRIITQTFDINVGNTSIENAPDVDSDILFSDLL